jgi:hypothetical protein
VVHRQNSPEGEQNKENEWPSKDDPLLYGPNEADLVGERDWGMPGLSTTSRSIVETGSAKSSVRRCGIRW